MPLEEALAGAGNRGDGGGSMTPQGGTAAAAGAPAEMPAETIAEFRGRKQLSFEEYLAISPEARNSFLFHSGVGGDPKIAEGVRKQYHESKWGPKQNDPNAKPTYGRTVRARCSQSSAERETDVSTLPLRLHLDAMDSAVRIPSAS